MTEPTRKQIKEFWEGCGLFTRQHPLGWDMWYSPDKEFIGNDPPPIDLNNLFKYAVPMLPTTCDMYLSVHWERPGYYTCTIQDIHIKGFRSVFITDKDPALALF